MTLVTVRRLDGLAAVALVTLNRPEQRNALSSAMLEQLTATLGDLAVEPDVRAIVLAGAGPDFCAGADVAELAEALSGPGAVEAPSEASPPSWRTSGWTGSRRAAEWRISR